jgi:hypothetical protein
VHQPALSPSFPCIQAALLSYVSARPEQAPNPSKTQLHFRVRTNQTQVRAICDANPKAPGCADCAPDWEAGKKWANCDLLATYAKQCGADASECWHVGALHLSGVFCYSTPSCVRVHVFSLFPATVPKRSPSSQPKQHLNCLAAVQQHLLNDILPLPC